MKKLAGLSIKCDLRSKSTTFMYKINTFQIKKVIDIWTEVFSSCQRSHSHHIPISLNSYSIVNLVSISFAKSFDLTPCTKPKHRHVVPTLKSMGEIIPQTYNFYHLRLSIIDCFNYIFDFTHPFLAIDRNPRNSQVLLG